MQIHDSQADRIISLIFQTLTGMEDDKDIKCPSCGLNHYHDYLPKECALLDSMSTFGINHDKEIGV